RAHAGELLAVPADDNIALPDAGGGRRGRFIETHRHRADAIVKLDGLQPHPEIATRDPAMGFKPSCDPADCRAGNDKNTSHPLNSHTAHFTCGGEREAALVAVSQSHAELDPGVYLTTAQASP